MPQQYFSEDDLQGKYSTMCSRLIINKLFLVKLLCVSGLHVNNNKYSNSGGNHLPVQTLDLHCVHKFQVYAMISFFCVDYNLQTTCCCCFIMSYSLKHKITRTWCGKQAIQLLDSIVGILVCTQISQKQPFQAFIPLSSKKKLIKKINKKKNRKEKKRKSNNFCKFIS